MNVKTNVARCFLKLIGKHFPKTNPLYKLFNKNNVKVSYSCLPNISTIIASHNKSVLSKENDADKNTCNCQKKEQCPLENKCLDKSLIYSCNVKEHPTDEGSTYIGLTEKTFKDRWYKHRNSFKYESKANSTELSKKVWELKKKSINEPIMNWKDLDHANSYVNGSNKCNLCITEKFHIITSSDMNLMNKKCELVSKCRHENKFILANYKAIPPD